MTRMTGPDCAVMCNLINIHTHLVGQLPQGGSRRILGITPFTAGAGFAVWDGRWGMGDGGKVGIRVKCTYSVSFYSSN